MDAETKELTTAVRGLLDSGKYKEVLSLCDDNKYKEVLRNGSWDFIPAIVSKIQDNTLLVTPALFSTCEKLLDKIVEKGNAEEVLLELIEQIETAKNDAQFVIALQPMQKVLLKLKNKGNRSLEWCFNAILTYIESIPIPEHNLEGQERLLMDSDDNIRRIEKVYSHLPNFYHCFIDEVIRGQLTSPVDTRKVILSFLVGLLGKPLIYIDVKVEGSTSGAARKYSQIIVEDVCQLEKNLFKLLSYVEYKYKENDKNSNQNNVDNDLEDFYLHNEKLHITSLSALCYITLSGDFQLPDFALPQVYNPEYIVRTSLLSVLHLLSFTAYGPLTKGLSLCKALFARLSKPVQHCILSSSIHSNISKALVNTAVFSNYEITRKEAVNLIGQQVNMFDYKGRCILVKCLLDMANHSGVIGYAITLYKNSIEEVFKCQSVIPECFVGSQMLGMLKKILFLPHGAESDLVEMADQIITALNFIIYISLKDSSNVTGIRDYYQYIETQYLDKLRVALDMSKAHYQVKLKDIEEGGKVPQKKIDISINVGGNVLDDIPVENQKQVINSALNAFHLMEGLLARARECIIINKSRV